MLFTVVWISLVLVILCGLLIAARLMRPRENKDTDKKRPHGTGKN